jgi:hypothetical protein
MVLRPFPVLVPAGQTREQLNTRYREDLVSLAGTAIFLFGNRLSGSEVVAAAGVEEEFNIAVQQGLAVIPIGATGYTARSLWERVMSDFDRYLPRVEGIKRPYARLGKSDADDDTIVAALLEILDRLKGER